MSKGVLNISVKIRENTEEDVVMRTWKLEVSGLRKIGRPKLRWNDVIKKDMKEKGVKIEEDLRTG